MSDLFRRHLKSYLFAFRGLKDALSLWSNLRIEVCIGLMVIVSGLFFGVSSMEWLFLITAIFLVVSLELLNTAVEVILDFLKKEHHEDIRLAKDIAAAAVLVCAFGALIIGLIIFLPRLINLIRSIGPIGSSF